MAPSAQELYEKTIEPLEEDFREFRETFKIEELSDRFAAGTFGTGCGEEYGIVQAHGYWDQNRAVDELLISCGVHDIQVRQQREGQDLTLWTLDEWLNFSHLRLGKYSHYELAINDDAFVITYSQVGQSQELTVEATDQEILGHMIVEFKQVEANSSNRFYKVSVDGDGMYLEHQSTSRDFGFFEHMFFASHFTSPIDPKIFGLYVEGGVLSYLDSRAQNLLAPFVGAKSLNEL